MEKDLDEARKRTAKLDIGQKALRAKWSKLQKKNLKEKKSKVPNVLEMS